MTDKRVIVIAVTIIITTALAFYWFGQREIAGTRESVTIGIARQPITSLLVVAEQQGYFEEEGLDVTFVRYTIGQAALDAALAGENDFATVADTPVVFQSFERNDFRIVATIGSDDLMGLLARRDTGIRTIEDLRGRRVAVTRGTAPHFFLHSFLLERGLSTRDVELVFESPNELPAALQRGEVDAIATVEPVLGDTKRLLGDNGVVFEDSELYRRTFHLVALKDPIEERPDVIEKILRALLKAEKFVEDNPERAINIIAGEQGLDEAELASRWDEIQFRVSLDQSILIQLEEQARWAIANNLTTETRVPNYLDYVYTDGLNAVADERVGIGENDEN